MNYMKKYVDPKVSEYFRKIGSKSGKKLLAERGPEYFSRISKMRKVHGRQKKTYDVSGTMHVDF